VTDRELERAVREAEIESAAVPAPATSAAHPLRIRLDYGSPQWDNMSDPHRLRRAPELNYQTSTILMPRQREMVPVIIEIWTEDIDRLWPTEITAAPPATEPLPLSPRGAVEAHPDPTPEPNKRAKAIAAALARGFDPGTNIHWGQFTQLIINECGASDADRGFSERQIKRLVNKHKRSGK
jgi:hypothetical protein